MFDFNQVNSLLNGDLLSPAENRLVQSLLIDSRKIANPADALFFAIKGPRHDGHKFLTELYSKGVRQFVVEEDVDISKYPGSNFIKVRSSVDALQTVAAAHRARYSFPVTGITGSNGKTIVKEWLSQLLSRTYNVVRNPKSYNSQVGVPLSVWQMNETHQFGIFEAGISLPGEMARLENVIKPDIGIITNLLFAHDEGFSSRTLKAREKVSLFRSSKIVLYCADYEEIEAALAVEVPEVETLTWGYKRKADFVIKETSKTGRKTKISGIFKGKELDFVLPFSDDASVENILHCILLMLYLNLEQEEIQSRINGLQSVAMRLEMKEGLNRSYIIDDTYNNDLAGLTIAINFLEQQHQRERKTIILSDLLETGMEEEELYRTIADMLKSKKINRLIGIGEKISRFSKYFTLQARFYKSTGEFLETLKEDDFEKEIILVKGARVFGFEKIVKKLQSKLHGTIFEVNLDALSSNLNFYRSKLRPETKIMVMVKAFAYGSGSFEVANLLQFHRIDYLAVAYADEGIALRENGISLPVMVMNPSETSFEKLLQYNLEPEIYSFKILKEYISFLNSSNSSSKIHVKIDTGMHRLGFNEEEIEELAGLLKRNKCLKPASVFTHLAGADEQEHEEFCWHQINKFRRAAEEIEQKLGITVIKHALNSAGIVAYPTAQMDMVRLGIGLYGVEATGTEQSGLQTVGTLKTIISQIKRIPKGESIGYSRKGRALGDIRIATIAIGYADGYDRRFSNGKGKVLIGGVLCPVIGNVCMDMTMIDITDTQAEEGDEVIVFGKNPSINDAAKEIGTIAYELLTEVSERVKRVFYAE